MFFLNYNALLIILSLKETICSETPILVIPMIAEQGYNANLALAMGIARSTQKFTYTSDLIYNEVKIVSAKINNFFRMKNFFV